MPKENINCSDESDTRVVVAWRSAPEGHVQVATENPDGSVSVVDEQITGWYVTLNREQINRLVRCLRRARDSAFGPDA